MQEVIAGQRDNALLKDVAAGDVAVLLTSLIQGLAIRWSLGARDFVLRDEGLRLLAVQLRLRGVRGG
jgi:hypothetical protein